MIKRYTLSTHGPRFGVPTLSELPIIDHQQLRSIGTSFKAEAMTKAEARTNSSDIVQIFYGECTRIGRRNYAWQLWLATVWGEVVFAPNQVAYQPI